MTNSTQSNNLRLMGILAHPDDESLGFGGTFAKYGHEGVETYLLMATRGERGRYGTAEVSPGPDIVGKAREKELMDAAKVLKIKEVTFLDYMDADLDKADPKEIIPKISGHIQRIKPHVVITFGPEGGYGHPDHIAISQFATAAIVHAAGALALDPPMSPWQVSKLYYMGSPPSRWELYKKVFKELSITVDGVKRKATPIPDWVLRTRIDASEYWETVWKAILCHNTQMAAYRHLKDLDPEDQKNLFGHQAYYRVFSLVNGGRELEEDLFEGIE